MINNKIKNFALFISSWKTAVYVLIIYIGILGLDPLFETYFKSNSVGLIFYLARPKIKTMDVNSNQLKIPFPMYIDNLDYWEGTDSLLAAYIQTGQHLLIVSAPKDCMDTTSRYFSNLVTDSVNVLFEKDSKNNFYFRMMICDDTVFCYYIKNYWFSNDIHHFNFSIPSRCLSFEIQGEDVNLQNSMEYARRVIYWREKKFVWSIIRENNGSE
jgi:hypothetical protein